ncbi:hypothetical protein [Planctomicrobium sp. SH527]|uniref:hypothetical protein n=1 Tax=Planctomicrobium sp. SH527 TaxID=3448123 RepID=UPI003F5B49F9
MTPKRLSGEFYELLNALLNESITEDEHLRLQDWLKKDSHARCEYYAWLDLHLHLKKVAALPGLQTTQRMASPLRSSRLLFSVLQFTVPVLLILGGLCITEVLRDRNAANWQNQPVDLQSGVRGFVAKKPAVLSQSAGAEFFGELMPKVNSALPFDHTFALTSGQIELTFPAGATAVLEAPAIFTILESDLLDLKIGSCSIHAPPGAEGFKVTTPCSQVVDLGTRFHVGVSEFGQAEVQVVEGAAELHMSVDKTPAGKAPAMKTLVSGEAAKASRNKADIEELPFRESSFVTHLPDRVIAFDASTPEGGPGVRDLESVTVQRGGVSRIYQVEELIGIDVISFKANRSKSNVAYSGASSDDPLAGLTEDVALNTGVFNAGSRTQDQYDQRDPDEDYRDRPGMAVRFRTPVINGAGPDVVLFEVQSPVYPADGDSFRVGPLQATPGIRDHLISRYDITLRSRNALPVMPFFLRNYAAVPQSLEDLNQLKFFEVDLSFQVFSALAVGIDLSDLGYPVGAQVDALFFEAVGDEGFYFDPVFIGGFPPISESS